MCNPPQTEQLILQWELLAKTVLNSRPPQNYHTEFKEAFNPPQSFHSNRLYKFMDLAAGMQIRGYYILCIGTIGLLENVYISKDCGYWNGTNIFQKSWKQDNKDARKHCKSKNMYIIQSWQHYQDEESHNRPLSRSRCMFNTDPSCLNVWISLSKQVAVTPTSSPAFSLKAAENEKLPSPTSSTSRVLDISRKFHVNNPASCHISRRTKLFDTFWASVTASRWLSSLNWG